MGAPGDCTLIVAVSAAIITHALPLLQPAQAILHWRRALFPDATWLYFPLVMGKTATNGGGIQ